MEMKMNVINIKHADYYVKNDGFEYLKVRAFVDNMSFGDILNYREKGTSFRFNVELGDIVRCSKKNTDTEYLVIANIHPSHYVALKLNLPHNAYDYFRMIKEENGLPLTITVDNKLVK
jgi:hypothetical protein